MKLGAATDSKIVDDQVISKKVEPITYKEFIQACENGNLEKVEEGIHTLSPDVIASPKNDALRAAAKNGHLSVVNRLLEIAEVREAATALANVYNLELLKKDGALWKRILVSENYFNRPLEGAVLGYMLCHAAKEGHLTVINRLLETDEMREAAKRWGNKALTLAAKNGHHLVVNRLLEIDEVRESEVRLNSALNLAAENGHLLVVNRLLEIPAVKENAAALKRALWSAAENGHHLVVNRLLEIDAVLDEVSVKHPIFPHRTLLDSVAEKGHLAVVRRLLEIDAVREVAAQNEFSNVLSRCIGWAAGDNQVKVTLGNEPASNCLINDVLGRFKNWAVGDKPIETVIGKLAEKHPNLKTSIEKDKRKNEAKALYFAFKAVNRRVAEKPKLQSPLRGAQRDVLRVISRMVKNSLPPAEQPEGLLSKKTSIL
ncbi:MAG: ankyrin repeat domain-containing protein [Proteobacteria bacterium]|nr:ankyrin repeat domain-containing protein [Pseudomonadota bacterium]